MFLQWLTSLAQLAPTLAASAGFSRETKLVLPLDVWEIIIGYVSTSTNNEGDPWEQLNPLVFAGKAVGYLALRQLYTTVEIKSHKALLSFALPDVSRLAYSAPLLHSGTRPITGPLVQRLDLSDLYRNVFSGERVRPPPSTLYVSSPDVIITTTKTEEYMSSLACILPSLPHLNALILSPDITISPGLVRILCTGNVIAQLHEISGVGILPQSASVTWGPFASLISQAHNMKRLGFTFKELSLADLTDRLHHTADEDPSEADVYSTLPSTIYDHPSITSLAINSTPPRAFADFFPEAPCRPCAMRDLRLPQSHTVSVLLRLFGPLLSSLTLYCSEEPEGDIPALSSILAICPNLIRLTLDHSTDVGVTQTHSLQVLSVPYLDQRALVSLERTLDAGRLPSLRTIILRLAGDPILVDDFHARVKRTRGTSAVSGPDWTMGLRIHGLQLVDGDGQIVV